MQNLAQDQNYIKNHKAFKKAQQNVLSSRYTSVLNYLQTTVANLATMDASDAKKVKVGAIASGLEGEAGVKENSANLKGQLMQHVEAYGKNKQKMQEASSKSSSFWGRIIWGAQLDYKRAEKLVATEVAAIVRTYSELLAQHKIISNGSAPDEVKTIQLKLIDTARTDAIKSLNTMPDIQGEKNGLSKLLQLDKFQAAYETLSTMQDKFAVLMEKAAHHFDTPILESMCDSVKTAAASSNKKQVNQALDTIAQQIHDAESKPQAKVGAANEVEMTELKNTSHKPGR
jgi:hypothetical protein